MDFGDIFARIYTGIIQPFLNVNIQMFGLQFPVWGLLAWSIVGGVVLKFVRTLGDS